MEHTRIPPFCKFSGQTYTCEPIKEVGIFEVFGYLSDGLDKSPFMFTIEVYNTAPFFQRETTWTALSPGRTSILPSSLARGWGRLKDKDNGQRESHIGSARVHSISCRHSDYYILPIISNQGIKVLDWSNSLRLYCARGNLQLNGRNLSRILTYLRDQNSSLESDPVRQD